MAEYELPPLRIKIVGDGKSWEKTTEQTIKQARQLAASLEKIGSSVKASVINKSVRQAVSGIHKSIASHISSVANNVQIARGLGSQSVRKAMRDAVGNILTHVSLHIEQVASLTSRLRLGGGTQVNKTMREATRLIMHYILIGIRRMVVSAHSVRVAGASQVNKTMRDANKLVLHYILIGIRRMVVSAHSVKTAGSGMVNRVMRQALDVILHSLITRIRLMAVTAHTVRGSAAPLRREVRGGINTIINYIILAVRGTITQALAGINTRQFVNNLRRGVQAGVNNTRFTPTPGNQNIRGGSGGGMGGLGDRADIYMHINAIHSLASAWRFPLTSLAEYQQRIATLTPVIGSKEGAKTFLERMSQETVGLIYGMDQIALATSRLTSSNLTLEQTSQLLESIGNIAGGDAERFEGLARAVAQISSQKYLQGDETEQLNERLFPAMQLLEKHSGVSQDKLLEMRQKRQLPSAAIVAVINAEAAAGGKYAGTMNNLSTSLSIATKRVQNFYTKLNVRVMETVEAELVKYVDGLASCIVQMINWVDANKDVVKGYVQTAFEVTRNIAMFHLFGLAVAYTKWVLRSLGVVTMFVAGVFRFLYGTIKFVVQMLAVMRGALALTQVSLIATWITALGPVGAVIAGIAAVAFAIYLVVESLTNPDGLMGAFKSVFTYASGFFKWLAKQFGFDYDKGLTAALGFELDPKLLKDIKTDIPEAPVVDWNSLLGGKGGVASGADVRTDFKLNDSLSKFSGEAKQRRWEQQMILAGWESGAKNDKQDKMVNALENIERNTRPNGWQKAVQWIEPANLAGVP